PGVLSLQRLVAEACEHGCDRAPDNLVILDQQDALATGAEPQRTSARRLLARRLAPREEELHHGAAAGLASEDDVPTRLLDEAEHAAQAEAGSLAWFLSRDERLENPVLDLRGDARARICNGDHHVFAAS